MVATVRGVVMSSMLVCHSLAGSMYSMAIGIPLTYNSITRRYG